MKTGRLLDIFSGHEGPVHGLMFSPTNVSPLKHKFELLFSLLDEFPQEKF